MKTIYQEINEISNSSWVEPEDQFIATTTASQEKIIQFYENLNITDSSFYLTKAINDVIAGSVAQIPNAERENRFTVIDGLQLFRNKITIKEDESNVQYLELIMSPGLLIFDSNLIELAVPKVMTINIPFIDVFITRRFNALILVGEYTHLKRDPIQFHLFFYDTENKEVFNPMMEWNDDFFIYRTLSIAVNEYPRLHLFFDTYFPRYVYINDKELRSRFFNYYRTLWMIRIIEFIGFSPFVDVPYQPPIPRSSYYALAGIFL